jgi:hypothetical protein
MEVLYILFGWLLGLLSPGIVNHIKNHYERISLHRVVIHELKDLKKKINDDSLYGKVSIWYG